MKITTSLGEVQFELRHQYDGQYTHLIKQGEIRRDRLIETIQSLKVLGELSVGAAQPDLIKWWERELMLVRGDITRLKQCPVKTFCTLTDASGNVYESFASIRYTDALLGLHSRKMGRKAAIANLLKCLKERGMSKAMRREIYMAISPRQSRKDKNNGQQ
jgi:hypothetical protein